MESVACGIMFCRANFEGFESWTNGFLNRDEETEWCKEGWIDKIGFVQVLD